MRRGMKTRLPDEVKALVNAPNFWHPATVNPTSCCPTWPWAAGAALGLVPASRDAMRRTLFALAPVPLDYVSDRERDLVLSADAGSGHVER
jgi:hypothetical protein